MNVRHGILALFLAGALANQASAQFVSPFGMGFGGYPGYGGYGYPGYGGYGGYGYPGMGMGWGGGFSVPTVWQTGPIVAYTSGRVVTQPVIPPDSPLRLDPNFDNWARQNGYYLRPNERMPRYRTALYPATPVDAADLAMPRELGKNR